MELTAPAGTDRRMAAARQLWSTRLRAGAGEAGAYGLDPDALAGWLAAIAASPFPNPSGASDDEVRSLTRDDFIAVQAEEQAEGAAFLRSQARRPDVPRAALRRQARRAAERARELRRTIRPVPTRKPDRGPVLRRGPERRESRAASTRRRAGARRTTRTATAGAARGPDGSPGEIPAGCALRGDLRVERAAGSAGAR